MLQQLALVMVMLRNTRDNDSCRYTPPIDSTLQIPDACSRYFGVGEPAFIAFEMATSDTTMCRHLRRVLQMPD